MVKIPNFSPNIFYAEQCNSKSSSFTKGDMQLQNKFDLFGTFSDLPFPKHRGLVPSMTSEVFTGLLFQLTPYTFIYYLPV